MPSPARAESDVGVIFAPPGIQAHPTGVPIKQRRLQANNVVITLSQIYTKAQDWGIVVEGTNPCRHVELYRQRKRERFLTEVEFERLGRVLDEAVQSGGATPEAIAAIRLLILTGCRRGEILRLRWDEVDLQARELRLRDTKTGLHDVRLHDLRHSFASSALALGESLPMIARLLGHRQIASTARYAHLARASVHEAANRVADSLAEDIL